jgi:hypothetical protein
MVSDLSLNIGGIIIFVQGCPLDDDPQSLRTYNFFVTRLKNKADILLRLHKSRFDHGGAERAFDCLPTWALYLDGQKRVIEVYPEMPEIRRTLVMSRHGTEADLYLNEDVRALADAFYGPTLELLMVSFLALGKGAIIHACGISRKETGIIFVGESGAGKSTIARLLSEEKGIEVLSDDRVIVRRENGSLRIYGTPWHGSGAFASPKAAKLKRIFFLRHGTTNSITKVEGIDPPSRLLTCSFPPYWDSRGMQFTLEFFADLTAQVPCYELNFRPDRSIVDFFQTIAGT